MARKKKRAKQQYLRTQNLTTLANELPQHVSSTAHLPHPPFGPRTAAPAPSDYVDSRLPTMPPSQPSLGQRFSALPTELRLHIFSFLLVLPVKRQRLHNQDCPLRTSEVDLTPHIHPHTYHALPHRVPPTSFDTCIRCVDDHFHGRAPLWQRHNPPRVTWSNPWRSEWAPPVTNEFMCSDCWDEHFRPRPHPNAVVAMKKGYMRCLCARRQHLHVLLVCKRWYEEAGLVFYSCNTFAFEDASTFAGFVNSLSPHWRALVSKVSIMAYSSNPSARSAESSEFVAHAMASLEPAKALFALWKAVRSLPALVSLEIDALYLTRVNTVNTLQRICLRNLRQARFILRNPKGWLVHIPNGGSDYICPEYANARLLVGGLAEEVGRTAKGQRTRWLKRGAEVKTAVAREVERQKALLLPLTKHEPLWERAVPSERYGQARGGDGEAFYYDEALYYDDDVEVWTRLWRRFGGAQHVLHAYLPTVDRRAMVLGQSGYPTPRTEK